MASSFFSPFTRIGPSVTFSVASLCGKRLNSWKTMPHFMRISCTSFLNLLPWLPHVTCTSPTLISPLVGSSRKFRQRRNVLLPEPDGPMSTSTSPL